MRRLSVVSGTVRHLSGVEKLSYPEYKYVTVSEFSYSNGDRRINIPPGFLTGGSSGGPDYGSSWLFHDYLYATHRFTDGKACTRVEADEVMEIVLKNERPTVYCWIFAKLAKLNPFWLFSRSWKNSGNRGADVVMYELKKDI